jgi:hypothetical protein
MGRYAENTTVSVDKSIDQIEYTLAQYGADSFGYKKTPDFAAIEFLINGLTVQIGIPMPKRDDRRFTHTPERGTRRDERAALKAWATACRSQWRKLLLLIKAKMEAIEEGITTIEKEFLADIQIPGKGSVGQYLLDHVEELNLPALLPQTTGGNDE